MHGNSGSGNNMHVLHGRLGSMRFMWESSIVVIKVFMHAMHDSRDTVGVGTQVLSLSKHASHGNGDIIRAGRRD